MQKKGSYICAQPNLKNSSFPSTTEASSGHLFVAKHSISLVRLLRPMCFCKKEEGNYFLINSKI
jgi:hypothetical protein